MLTLPEIYNVLLPRLSRCTHITYNGLKYKITSLCSKSNYDELINSDTLLIARTEYIIAPAVVPDLLYFTLEDFRHATIINSVLYVKGIVLTAFVEVPVSLDTYAVVAVQYTNEPAGPMLTHLNKFRIDEYDEYSIIGQLDRDLSNSREEIGSDGGVAYIENLYFKCGLEFD